MISQTNKPICNTCQVRRVLNTYLKNVKQYVQILISRVTSKKFSTLMKLQKSSRLSRNATLLTDLLTQSIFIVNINQMSIVNINVFFNCVQHL